MSILDRETEVGNDQHDYDFSGGSNVVGVIAGRHEMPPCTEPTALDPEPGRFELDPEETDMNTSAALKVERARLRELAPGTNVLVGKTFRSFEGESGDAESVEWNVSITGNGVMGICYSPVENCTLREACDAALSSYRAKALDANKEGVAA